MGPRENIKCFEMGLECPLSPTKHPLGMTGHIWGMILGRQGLAAEALCRELEGIKTSLGLASNVNLAKYWQTYPITG